MQLPVYLDNNATTPMDPRVLEEMLPYFTLKFGNAASRSHTYGWEAEEAVEVARERIGELIGARPQEIIFTSGATEGVNLALKGVLENTLTGKHIITCETEHKAVLDTCQHLEKHGYEVTRLPVKPDGVIDTDELQKSIRKDTVLISVMYANNETGVVQPVSEIGTIAKKHRILFFTDATQAIGKIPVDVRDDNIDILSFSGHKIYGPKGVGALYVRRKNPAVSLTAQIDGGGHQRGMRSGTLNVPGIVGLGKAAELCMQEMDQEYHKLRAFRDIFENKMLDLGNVTVNSQDAARLPHCLNISFGGIDGEKLMMQANRDLAFSQSSACTSATLEPSYVLKAMGLEDGMIHNSFRFSFGRFTTDEQVDYAIRIIAQLVTQHRNEMTSNLTGNSVFF
ncbi:cysteine desulfurase family protein [Dyadobacter helix]|uniref:cysteine desulfurase family protein n=1 Tax=Dyadobacter helix TaxID=2822344 RepID=UPI001BFC53BF|nr:IscS subfamily cysteine desulfurase [Dyadobacter sp. CECT 9275]